MVSKKRECLADLIHIIHKILVYYTMFGCFLPEKYAKYHYFIWPLIRLHWLTNKNYCILSQIELNLRNKKHLLKTVDKDHEDGDSGFMKIVFKQLFGIELTVKKSDDLTRIIFTISALISFYRFSPLLKKNQ